MRHSVSTWVFVDTRFLTQPWSSWRYISFGDGLKDRYPEILPTILGINKFIEMNRSIFHIPDFIFLLAVYYPKI